MAKDFEDGVWRTVGGRRIFIRDGQSLSDAMKSSGKFKGKTAKQKVEEGKKKLAESYSDEELDQEIKSYQKELKELEADYTGVPSQYRAAQTEQYGKRYDEIENRINELKAEKKARKSKDIMNMDPNEFKKEAELEKRVAIEKEQFRKEQESSKVKTLSGKNETDNKGREVSQKEYDEFRQAYKDGRISQEDYRNDNYDAMKRAQATAYLKQNSNLTDKQAQDYANRLEKQASSKSVKTQQSDIEQVTGSKVKESFETDLYGNGKETRFMLDDGRWVSHTTESFGDKVDQWSVNELKNGKIDSTNYKSYDDMMKNLGKSGSGDWVRNAFNQYKKDHPGTKMTIADFKKANKK